MSYKNRDKQIAYDLMEKNDQVLSAVFMKPMGNTGHKKLGKHHKKSDNGKQRNGFFQDGPAWEFPSHVEKYGQTYVKNE